MKIGIVGFGFVGKAVKFGFTGEYLHNEFFISDPVIPNSLSIKEICDNEVDVIFICVPTPTDDGWVQDDSIMLGVLEELSGCGYPGVVVVKSTIIPGFLKDYSKLYSNLKLVYNPEFLTARIANEDFINAPMIVLGGDPIDCERIKHCYVYNSICKNVSDEYFVFTDMITASLIKYALNSWFATKVIFMNELFKIWKKSGAASTWNDLASAIEKDPRVGNSHNQVPGHDGLYGFGGACFPKDTKAFHTYSKLINEEFTLLKQVIIDNNKLRKEV